MPAASFVASTTESEFSVAAMTPTIPATVQSGDFMLVIVKSSSNSAAEVWDDDGGGGNGWTRQAYNRTTGGRDQETAIYWKFHTGTETNPTFTLGANQPMSLNFVAYRGVDTTSPINDLTWEWNQNDANPPNPSVTVNNADTRVVCMHAATHDDITTPAAPTGFTMRAQVWNGTNDDHRNLFTADIAIASAQEYSPPNWQHSVSNTTPEYQTYSIALNASLAIQINGGTVLDGIFYSDTNKTVTGSGFGAAQGTGTVELWSDTSGTIKQAQTIDSWSDTSIQFDIVQGSLPNNTTIYVVVTNDNGDATSPSSLLAGIDNYDVALKALYPDHYWRLNNTYDDTGITGPTRNMTSGVVGTWTFSSTNIADGNTHALNISDATARREIADSPNMNVTNVLDERTIAFWLQVNEVVEPLACIWKEGGGVQNLCFLLGYGNTLIFQGADSGGNPIENAQSWSDFKLKTNRPYHVCGRYSLTESPKELRLFIDGVQQAGSQGNPLGATGNFDSHSGDVVWNDPDTSLETGGTDIAYNGLPNAVTSDWCTWSDNSTGTNAGGLDKTTEIRDVLYRRGAKPADTIASGTQSAMQTSVNSLTATRADWPLSIRVEEPTGGGNLELTMNGASSSPLVFNSGATSHVEWRGAGVLTLVRTPGGNLDAAKCWATGPGSITVVDDVVLKVTVKDFTGAVVVGARVLLTAASGGSAVVGTTLLSGTTDSNGVLETTIRYSSDQPLEGVIRKGSSSTFYQEAGVSGTIASTGFDQTIFIVRDE